MPPSRVDFYERIGGVGNRFLPYGFDDPPGCGGIRSDPLYVTRRLIPRENALMNAAPLRGEGPPRLCSSHNKQCSVVSVHKHYTYKDYPHKLA